MLSNIMFNNSPGQFCYQNGNYLVRHDYFQTKINKRCFRIGEDFMPLFPDSIDLKLSNRCSWGCSFCHESSTPDGKIFNLEKTKNILSQIPSVPIEVAIGGGDIFDSAEEVLELIKWMKKEKNFLIRITFNLRDIEKYEEDKGAARDILQESAAWGVSIPYYSGKVKEFFEGISKLDHLKKEFGEDDELPPFKELIMLHSGRIVFQIIAGLFPNEDISELLKGHDSIFHNYEPLLVLGYKQWGRASNSNLPKGIKETEKILKTFICDRVKDEKNNKERLSCFGKIYTTKTYRTLGFDNLAIEQLGIKEVVPEEYWEQFYMGEEGSSSMYIDAVEETFARNSTSSERISWDSMNLLDFFKSLR